MDEVFRILGRHGKEIYLSKERWAHIVSEHPEVAPYFPEFEPALRNPGAVKQFSEDPSIFYFYRFIKPKRRFLLVIVKYLNGEGFVITAYLVRHIQ
ncbi:hypothetical protein HYV84_07180 [Candidatus Woesearchaeota archaeon]|nr:hypothetical protein [Candidatus Woesearchaeota archaeon]